jgi:hypothetical protein
MKKFFLTTITIFVVLNLLHSQGVSKMEVWGENKSKKEFVELYKQHTGIDINYNKVCAAELKKIGFKDCYSGIYLTTDKDVNDFMTGKLNWDKTSRIICLWKFPDNNYTKLYNDTIWLNELNQNLPDYKNFSNLDFIDSSLFTSLLLSTLSRNHDKLKDKSIKYLNRIELTKFEITQKQKNILGLMLSYPSPQVCRTAVKFISNLERKQSKAILLSNKCITLRMFLNSKLNNFKGEAEKFLNTVLTKQELVIFLK